MPIYQYQCTDCGAQDQRLGGIDDRAALCLNCGALMLRQDEDVFAPYFLAAADDHDAPSPAPGPGDPKPRRTGWSWRG